MAIPALDPYGLLPQGIYDCTLEEIRSQFGSFQRSDRRPQLFKKLETFVREARSSEVVRSVLVDGSFATDKPEPNDVDLIVVVAFNHDFVADLPPAAYNVLSKRQVHRKFGFDLLVARENSVEYRRWTEFFEQVRLEPNRRKGILRLSL